MVSPYSKSVRQSFVMLRISHWWAMNHFLTLVFSAAHLAPITFFLKVWKYNYLSHSWCLWIQFIFSFWYYLLLIWHIVQCNIRNHIWHLDIPLRVRPHHTLATLWTVYNTAQCIQILLGKQQGKNPQNKNMRSMILIWISFTNDFVTIEIYIL